MSIVTIEQTDTDRFVVRGLAYDNNSVSAIGIQVDGFLVQIKREAEGLVVDVMDAEADDLNVLGSTWVHDNDLEAP